MYVCMYVCVYIYIYIRPLPAPRAERPREAKAGPNGDGCRNGHSHGYGHCCGDAARPSSEVIRVTRVTRLMPNGTCQDSNASGRGEVRCEEKRRGLGQGCFAVSSHNFNWQHFKLRVSDPRTSAYVHFNMPFESSNLPGAGPSCPDSFVKEWPYSCGFWRGSWMKSRPPSGKGREAVKERAGFGLPRGKRQERERERERENSPYGER